MPLSSAPFELLEQILGHAAPIYIPPTDQSDEDRLRMRQYRASVGSFASLCRVSRAWRDAAQRILFREPVIFRENLAVQPLARALRASPILANMVRTLTFDRMVSRQALFTGQSSWLGEHRLTDFEFMSAFLDCVSLCTCLHNVEFYGVAFRHRKAKPSVSWNWTELTTLPSIRRLVWMSSTPYQINDMAINEALLSFRASLEYLELHDWKVGYDCDYFDERVRPFQPSFTLPRLKQLTLVRGRPTVQDVDALIKCALGTNNDERPTLFAGLSLRNVRTLTPQDIVTLVTANRLGSFLKSLEVALPEQLNVDSFRASLPATLLLQCPLLTTFLFSTLAPAGIVHLLPRQLRSLRLSVAATSTTSNANWESEHPLLQCRHLLRHIQSGRLRNAELTLVWRLYKARNSESSVPLDAAEFEAACRAAQIALRWEAAENLAQI